MNPARLDLSESDRSRLRAVVSTIDRGLSCLALAGTPEDHRAATRELVTSWQQLVGLLALGPAPEVRLCPACQHVCMRAATRCGHCWASLPPVAAVAPVPAAFPPASKGGTR